MSDTCIRYNIDIDGNSSLQYELLLDDESYRLNSATDFKLPSWTRLSVAQCANCPLDEKSSPYCPTASNLAKLVEDVGRLASYDEASVTVDFGDKVVKSTTSVQRILSSLIGVLMASSDCPHCRYLRPMARFHQPLAAPLETVYRAVSMYTLAQYFIMKHGGEPDVTLSGLSSIYENLQVVNRGMAQRLRSVSNEDGAVNALVLLDMFAKDVPGSIEESLEDLRELFAPYCGR